MFHREIVSHLKNILKKGFVITTGSLDANYCQVLLCSCTLKKEQIESLY